LDTKPLAVSTDTLLGDNPKFLAELTGELDLDALNQSLDNVFDVVYSPATVQMDNAHITQLTVILPPDLAEILGVKEVPLKVKADSIIMPSSAYITRLRLKKYPITSEPAREKPVAPPVRRSEE